MRYRKKPVAVEARQYDGTDSCAITLALWSDGAVKLTKPWKADYPYLDIPTLEGVMSATVGDWIVKGVKGEFYPVRDDIFRETYEEAEEEAGG